MLPLTPSTNLKDEQPASEISRRGPLRRFLNRLEVDQATFYSLGVRIWQFLAGPISLLLIGTFFSRELQGFFYTFAYLIGLQSFFELGLHIVIINVASHEWLQLQLDQDGNIRGEPAAVSRLVSLGRWLFGWYATAAVLFAIGVGCAGVWFLALKDDGSIFWQTPWAVLVLLAAILLWQQPLVVLLEACGQIAVVNRFRLYQAITGNIVVWCCILLGAGLWAAVAATAVQVAWNSVLLVVRYRRFFAAFVEPASGPRLRWQREIWPMQWRLAISGVVSYYAISFIPVMWNYHGPITTGQMGMTWQLATVLQAVALAWVQTRAPLFGRLVAKRDYRELDRVYFRLVAISFSVVLTGCAGLVIAVWGLQFIEPRLAHRLLDPLPTAILLLGIVCYHVPNCQALYIRAHKRDPLFLLSVVSGLAIGCSIWWFGSRYGPLGAASAYLAIAAGIVLPLQSLIWWQCRRDHD